ncbi:MAG: preprotein translocase subunit SecE [Clostridia bacterium]|nr:preprotein translocase subunit SecE [Clostridia bacterium]
MKEKKQGLFSKIKNFFIDCKIELKKIVWPTQKTVWKNTGIVLALIFVVGVFVALLDTGFLGLLRMVMAVSTNTN